jgi:hypothetical protein
MKTQRVLIALTAVNFLMLALTLAQWRPAHAEDTPGVLRGRGLEIVDDRGRVRASISVMPAGVSKAGDAFPETVLLRLITERGRPAVKVSTTEEGSGLSFAGPTGTSETYITMGTKGKLSTLKLKNEDGREQVLKP